MNSEDYMLLKEVKPLTSEEYVKRIELYNEMSIEDRITIHNKCISNIMHHLSRIGMTVEEITHMMKHCLRSYEKMVSNKNKIENSAN